MSLLDVVDRLALVGGLDVREGVLHLVLPRRVLTEGEPSGALTRFWYSRTVGRSRGTAERTLFFAFAEVGATE